MKSKPDDANQSEPAVRPAPVYKPTADEARALGGLVRRESETVPRPRLVYLDGAIMGKPGNSAGACDQLGRSSGRCVIFHTGLCVLGPGELQQLDCIPFRVQFRQLDSEEIARYVAREQPLDCAGSFRWERLGISLFERLEGDDPTALEGLPLIALCRMLRRAGLDPLAA